MGEWAWRVVDLTGAAAGDFGNLLFVNGDRTPSTGISLRQCNVRRAFVDVVV